MAEHHIICPECDEHHYSRCLIDYNPHFPPNAVDDRIEAAVLACLWCLQRSPRVTKNAKRRR